MITKEQLMGLLPINDNPTGPLTVVRLKDGGKFFGYVTGLNSVQFEFLYAGRVGWLNNNKVESIERVRK